MRIKGGVVYRLGAKTPERRRAELTRGEPIVIDFGSSTLHTVYRPPRRRGESPIDYYRRTGCVDDRFWHVHKGRYYCNPAHCRRTWLSKRKRMSIWRRLTRCWADFDIWRSGNS
jgi:hypothetical protein